MSERTKGPWSAINQYLYASDRALPIASGLHDWATDRGGSAHDEACANAAAIVMWENSHDALVKALKLALLFIDPDEPPSPISNRAAAEAIRAALEKEKS
jgi:hypothetical protein